MARIALLHPQCVRRWWAIQMALQTAQVLLSQGHDVTFYTFERDENCFPDLQKGVTFIVRDGSKNWWLFWLKKLINIILLAWHLRQVDIIVANNPPIHIVAACAKFLNTRIRTLWWHHHIPWYMSGDTLSLRLRRWCELHCILPRIDICVATSHFLAKKIYEYSGRTSTVIHPVVNSYYETLATMLEYAPSQQEKQTNDILTLITHGRLEPEKWIDMIVRVWESLKSQIGGSLFREVRCVCFGSWSMSTGLIQQWCRVLPFDPSVFVDIKKWLYWHVVWLYCSPIDAFGMDPLECQIAGIPTLVLDRAGSTETAVMSRDGEPVGFFVQSESDIISLLTYYLSHISFQKSVSNVNFSHSQSYFFSERLSSDIGLLISKT